MTDFIIQYGGEFAQALIAGVIGWVFGRKKQNAEVDGLQVDNESKEIDNGSKVVHMYKEAIDDLGIRYEKKFSEVVELYERKVQMLTDEINLHKRIINQLKKEN